MYASARSARRGGAATCVRDGRTSSVPRQMKRLDVALQTVVSTAPVTLCTEYRMVLAEDLEWDTGFAAIAEDSIITIIRRFKHNTWVRESGTRGKGEEGGEDHRDGNMCGPGLAEASTPWNP